MPVERFFLDHPIELNEIAFLEEAEHHHLSRVLRVRAGEEVELVNGKGFLAKGTVKTIEKKSTEILITDIHFQEPPKTRFIIAQAILRQNKLDLIIEKGTELGMFSLWLFPADFSEKGDLSDNQMQRSRQLAISAMKQCGSLYEPEIKVVPALKKLGKVENSYFGDLREGAPLLMKVYKPSEQMVFFVGPEKGFSDKEVEILDSFAKGVSLHPNILRTETASLCALSQLHGY